VDRVSWKDPKSLRDVVYLLLTLVPPGWTVTYRVLAELVGTSPRAIGAYMRANRELVIVPCHRVVGSRGLGGFSLGLSFKVKLLELEGALGSSGVRVIRRVDEFWQVVEKSGYSIFIDAGV
jgi:methylated-DNA-[protein]-cysteine S-methyltransferase